MQSIPYSKEDTFSHDDDKRAKGNILRSETLKRDVPICNLSRIAKKILSHMTEIKEQRKHP